MLQFVYPRLELRFWWVAGWERKVFFYQRCWNYCLKKDLVWLGVPPTKQTKGYFLLFSPRYIYGFPIIFSFLCLGFKNFNTSHKIANIFRYICVSQVCDPTCFNLSELQQKLNAMCNYGWLCTLVVTVFACTLLIF